MGAAKVEASSRAVVEAMKNTATQDSLFGAGRIREDGRWTGNVYLLQVKTPAESTMDWDVYKLVETIPAAEGFRPLSEGGCPFVKA